MFVDFAASIAKESDAEHLNEDSYLFSLDRKVASLSDGASESFDSKSWAAILCGISCAGLGVSPESISQAVKEYTAIYDPSKLSWSKALAFERGNFATLLSCEYNKYRSEVEIVAVGDSVVIICEDDEVARRFPLDDPDQFNERPELLSTRNELNDFLKHPFFNIKHVLVSPVSSRTVLLLMTDAIGHWCYKAIAEGREEWRLLLSIDSDLEFNDFILKSRKEKVMKIDDTTLVRLRF
ncbi:MAG: hypothetical protein ACK418_03490 [Pseudomonas sp.]|uniref:hypothetical protein n=1 Tax=Pseudomonas sp. TaxID=306 RepID=UPI00391D7C3C